MNKALVIIAALAVTLAATAQHTSRRSLRPRAATETRATRVALEGADTCIALSGYEKPLRSHRESLFATSSAPDTVVAIALTITYLDDHGRQLHRRSVTAPCCIPPGQTRRIDLKSWDTQATFYYRLSAPARTPRGATPYDVDITADTVYINPRTSL